MKLNKKGYTLIELLAVIVVLGLIIGFSTYGIIKAYNNSKGKATIISESSIKKSANVFSEEKANDSDRWLDISSGKYFCTTIEELMNNGLLDKKAKIEGDNIKKYNYIVVKKNKVTLVNSEPKILIADTDSETDEYKVCTGNIKNEEINTYPSLEIGTSYTDEIRTPFTDGEAESKITNRKCLYGDTSGNINKEGKVVNNECVFENLKDNSGYYIRICMETEKNSTICSNTESRSTLQVKKPTYTSSDNTLTIKYDNTGISGEANYYFKSTINGTSNISVTRCTLSNNAFNCDGSTTTIEKDIWYRSSNDQISISYTTIGTANVTARTVDKSNNYSESTGSIKIEKYTVTFDPLGGIASFTTKKVEPGDVYGDLPTATKTGYTLVGWTSKNLFYYRNIIENSNLSYSNGVFKQTSADIRTDLQWKIQGFKGTTYVKNLTATKTQNSGTVSLTFTKDSSFDNLRFGVNGEKIDTLVRFDASSLTNGKTYTISAKIVNSTQGSVSWSNLQLEEGSTVTEYQDHIINASTKVTTYRDHKVYAVWTPNTYTITYNANGGVGGPSSQSYTYSPSGTITLSSDRPSKSGHRFLGWSLSSSATSASYSAGNSWNRSNANNYTLYAVWELYSKIMYINTDDGLWCLKGPQAGTGRVGAFMCGTEVEVRINPENTYWYYVIASNGPYNYNNCYSHGSYLSSSKPKCWQGGSSGCSNTVRCLTGATGYDACKSLIEKLGGTYNYNNAYGDCYGYFCGSCPSGTIKS